MTVVTMILTGVFVVTVSLIFVILYYLKTILSYWSKRNVLGPKPVILFGNLKDSTLRKETLPHSLQKYYNQFPDEPVIGIFRMTSPCLLLRDLDVLKNILIKDFHLFEDRGIEFSKEGLGANLFHADGDTWRILRTKFTPLFTTQKLKNMLYLVTERGDKFTNYVEGLIANQPEQPIHKLAKNYTISTIAACAFGLDVDTMEDSVTESLDRIDKLIFSRNFILELDMMFPWLLKLLNSSLFPAELKNFFMNLVKDVTKQRNGMPTDRNDFMDLLLEIKQEKNITGPKRGNAKELSLEFTDEVIAGQAFAFYAAGYETSATTLTFMLYELAMNQDIQNKLIQEIDKVLIKCKGQVTYDTLNQLPYMEKVMSETLRKYPIVDLLQRKALIDYKIPNTNVTVKKGQMVLVSALGIHHDEKYYPKPDVFDPERFDVQNSMNRHSCAYLPFGVGPRNCIGMRFAKVQSRVCLLKLLSRFRVEVSENTRKDIIFDKHRYVLAPEGGLYLNIVPRTDKKRV